MTTREYIAENKKRREALHPPYDPLRGVGSPIPREKVVYFFAGGNRRAEYLPMEMIENEPLIQMLKQEGSVERVIHSTEEGKVIEFMGWMLTIRMKYDFEFWCYATVKIQDKESKRPIPFKLNMPQRKLLKVLEEERRANEPIRVIVDKARQWGGSTEIQMYMGWIQTQWMMSWHSAIVAHVKDATRNIRAMFTRFAKHYPADLGSITLDNYEGSSNTKIIRERDCIIGIGSAETPDSFRSYDFSMLHLSESGMWKTTEGKSPEDLMQSLRSTVPEVPYSLIALESTAKGVGNFFHREWLAAIEGRSGYKPVFVSWWEIERYQRDIKDMDAFIERLEGDEYMRYLWSLGATLEGIHWYVEFKRRENYDNWRMASEYPSTWQESFQATGQRVYPPAYVQNARATCRPPEMMGDLTPSGVRGPECLEKIEFFESPNGLLHIWQWPDHDMRVSNRYAIFMDIGGTTPKADWTVIKVIDRYWMIDGGPPEIAAVWRGHIDQDLAAWKAAQIGMWYNKGLVAVETNSLNTKEQNTEGSHHLTVLDEIAPHYDNLYTRTDPDKVKEGIPVVYGFHMNVHTKSLIINRHKAAIRKTEAVEYIERDRRACDEMDTYEVKPNGKLGAVEGCHDDHVITTAGVVWMALNHMDPPMELSEKIAPKQKKVTGEATF